MKLVFFCAHLPSVSVFFSCSDIVASPQATVWAPAWAPAWAPRSATCEHVHNGAATPEATPEATPRLRTSAECTSPAATALMPQAKSAH